MNIENDNHATERRLHQGSEDTHAAREMLWAEALSSTLKEINLSKPHFDPALNLWGLETLLYIYAEPGQDTEHYARIAERPIKAIEGQLRQIAGMKRGMPVLFPHVEFRRGDEGKPGGWFLTETGTLFIQRLAETCIN